MPIRIWMITVRMIGFTWKTAAARTKCGDSVHYYFEYAHVLGYISIYTHVQIHCASKWNNYTYPYHLRRQNPEQGNGDILLKASVQGQW